MPTEAGRESMVAQVEEALRRRFFASVAKVEKPDRAGWPESQHDLDRLSRALAAYTLVALCGVDDASAASAVTDGSDDFGMDALYYDRPVGRLVVVQSKFKRTGSAPDQKDGLKTINGIRALFGRRFEGFNAALQARLDEVEEALDTPGVQVQLVLAFLGENVGPHVTADLNALQAELNVPGPRMSWVVAGLPTIHGWLVTEQAPPTVDVAIDLANWSWVNAPRRAVYGQISAVSLAQLVEAHGKTLFERNLRYYLGSVGVNVAIEETALAKPGDFFYLNNGLTAVAETITPAAGNRDQCRFGLKNFSIVNGAQTAGALASAAVARELSPDARVLLTVIEIGAGGDDIGLRITQARNYQNAVRGIDFAALDPRQEELRRELAAAGITYHYRPSAEARARRADAITLEEAALALACVRFPMLHRRDIPQPPQTPRPNAVDFVVVAKKEIGRLWDQKGAYYSSLFGAGLTGTITCRAVRVYRFLDDILAGSELSEYGRYHRRMFFRHGRYFIMALVAHRSRDVVDRQGLDLNEEERSALSRRMNELSEFVFATSQPLLAEKGYLAIFRNLTDAQPLADNVLDRIHERDAAAIQAAATAPIAPPPPVRQAHE